MMVSSIGTFPKSITMMVSSIGAFPKSITMMVSSIGAFPKSITMMVSSIGAFPKSNYGDKFHRYQIEFNGTFGIRTPDWLSRLRSR